MADGSKGDSSKTTIKTNDKLRMTQQLIAEEYQNMSSATHSVLATSENMHRAKDKYGKYSDKILRSQKLVEEIQKAERWDEQKLRYSFYFFVSTAVYLLLKRFFLWEIIFATYYLIVVFGSYVLEYLVIPVFKQSQNTGRGFVLMDYFLDVSSYTADMPCAELRFF